LPRGIGGCGSDMRRMVGPAPPARNFHRFRTQFWPGAGECSHVLTPSLTPSHEDVGAPWRTEATTTARRRNPPGRQRSAMNTVRPSLKSAVLCPVTSPNWRFRGVMKHQPQTVGRSARGKAQRSRTSAAPGVSWTVRRDAIERHRILRGWTRDQLAAAAQIDPKTLRDLLGGRRRPTLGTVGTVARAIDLTLGEVIVISEAASSERRLVTAPPKGDLRQGVLPLQ
jgi:ribosome-binding protein aMBF1 (putative translation factor)